MVEKALGKVALEPKIFGLDNLDDYLTFSHSFGGKFTLISKRLSEERLDMIKLEKELRID